MKLLKINYLYLFLLFFSNLIFAQDNGLEGWNSIGVSAKISDKVNVDISQHLRHKNNIYILDKYFTQVGINFELINDLKLGAKVRFISDNDNQGNIQGIEPHFRYQFELGYKKNIGIIDMTFRARYQNKNELGISDIAKEFFRFRLGLNYKIKPIKTIFKVEGEIYNQLSNHNEENGWNLYRLTYKLNFNLKGPNEIEAFYRTQNDIKRINAIDREIVGLKYTRKFNFTK